MSLASLVNPDVSFVVITYNDAGRLARCLRSAALMSAEAGLSHEILVVDNGSQDYTQVMLQEFAAVLGERLRVISFPHNTGTTVSRNAAFRVLRGEHVCVLDSDAELLPGDLARVIELLHLAPEVGIVGPAIIMPDGSTYNSVKMLPTLMDKLWKLPGIFSGRKTVNHDWYPDFPWLSTRCGHSVISCCWFFRRDLLDTAGCLDERIFYAPEDVEYCLRAWKSGRAVVYHPHYRVLHHTRQTSHKKPLSRIALSHFKGLLYYCHKHGYWFSRRRMEERFIAPLAARLDPMLAAWEMGRKDEP